MAMKMACKMGVIDPNSLQVLGCPAQHLSKQSIISP